MNNPETNKQTNTTQKTYKRTNNAINTLTLRLAVHHETGIDLRVFTINVVCQ
jgi:hypothetical protein